MPRYAERQIDEGADPRTHLGGRLTRAEYWEGVTVLTLFSTYAGLYFVRDHLLVVSEDFKAEEGVSAGAYGVMMALGYGVYLLGKLAGGTLAERWGGRRAALISMAGSTLFSLVFAFGSGVAYFTVMWVLMRGIQPFAWVGLVKIAGAWVPFERRGKAMAFLSLSFLVGDAVVRAILAGIVESVAWRELFYICSGCAALTTVPAYLLLRNTPAERGLPPVAEPPVKLTASAAAHPSFAATLRQLCRSAAFLQVCVLSFCFTLVRETFNTFSVEYLESLGASESHATALSTLFPAMGTVACLFAGYVVDHVPTRHRGCVPPIFGAPLVLVLLTLAASGAHSPGAGGFLVAAAGFCCDGPYTLLAGTFAIDLGGKHSSATASAVIDAAGYVGAIVIMLVSASDPGFQELFAVLAAVAALAAATGLLFWWTFGRVPGGDVAPGSGERFDPAEDLVGSSAGGSSAGGAPAGGSSSEDSKL